jgi:hypothetical protein
VTPARVKLYLFAAALLLAIAPSAMGQALPTAEASPISTGFSLPTTAGTLVYAVSASESLIWGYYGNSGASSYSNLSGDLAYISSSKRDPFSAVLAGGYSWSTSGQPSYGFANLGVSQVINAGRWTFVISDDVSYMPSTPTTGLSGIPGLGDLGLTPVQVGALTGQGALTDYSRRVNNAVSGSVQRAITGKTSVNASGYYAIARFLDNGGSFGGQGLDSDQVSGTVGINHQLNVRNTIGGDFSYSDYTYPGLYFGISLPGFKSETASFLYSHQVTRKLAISASAGPQWTTLDTAGSSTSLGVFVDSSASYVEKLSTASLSYVRSTNNGYGLIGGALSDSVAFTLSRQFGRVWNGSATASYTDTTSLPLAQIIPYKLSTILGGVQVSRAIAAGLSAYGSVTVQRTIAGGRFRRHLLSHVNPCRTALRSIYAWSSSTERRRLSRDTEAPLVDYRNSCDPPSHLRGCGDVFH